MEEEQAVEPVIDPRINVPEYRPAFQVGPTLDRGAEDEKQALDDKNRQGFFTSVYDMPDTIKRSFRSGYNFGYQIYRSMDRIIESGPVDEEWRGGNADEWIKYNKIDPEQAWRYRVTRNQNEAEAMLSDSNLWKEDHKVIAQRNGLTTFLAAGLVGVVDIDTPLTILGGGGLSKLATRGFMSTTSRRVLAQSGLAGAAGAVSAAGAYTADPNSDWTMIPLVGLANAGFGAVFGAAGARARAKRDAALNELGEQLDMGHPRANEDWRQRAHDIDSPLGNKYDDIPDDSIVRNPADEVATEAAETATEGAARKPTSIDVNDVAMELDQDTGMRSIGARQLNRQGPGVHTITDPKARARVADAEAYNARTGIAQDWNDGYFDSKLGQSSPGLAKAAEVFNQTLTKLGIGSDFTKLMQSNSAVARMIGYLTLESPSGILRNNDNAARIAFMYESDLGEHFIRAQDAFTAYAKEQGAGILERNWNANLRAQFDKEVLFERTSRRLDGSAYTPHKDANVRRAADEYEALFNKEVDISKGRPNEIAMHGADTLTKTPGYMMHRWSGRNVSRMIYEGTKRHDMALALAEAYRSLMPKMKQKDAFIIGKAVIQRAESMDEGINGSIASMLSGDGRKILTADLQRQGMSDKAIEKLIERMSGEMAERGKLGHLKGRVDIDPRFVASNGIKIVDMMDTDFGTLIPQRIRKVAGQAALARKGIRSKAEWDAWTDALMAEQRARGATPVDPTGTLLQKADDFLNADKHVDREFMEHLYASLTGGLMGGGISPMYSRIRKMTNLGLLNKLGLTQAYEMGNGMAAIGMGEYIRRMPEGIKAALHDKGSPLFEEMRMFNIYQPEDLLRRMDLTFDFEKRSTQNEFLRGFDRLLNKASHAQGYTSGFNHIRRMQQAIAVTGTADRLARHFKEGGLISDARLADMGFTPASMKAFKEYVDKGVVEFEEGRLKKLNLDQWSAEDREGLVRILQARSGQLVMRALAGESSYAFHKDGVAQLFFHLKSFALMTQEKQFLRNARMADSESAMQFIMGLGITGALGMVRNTIDGRTDRNDPISLARMSMTMNHMTGWLPMWTDPIAGLLGMGGISGYADRGDGPFAASASLSYMNKLAQLGVLPATMWNGMSNSEWNALQAFPIIGNTYGMTAFINAMKD